VPADQEVADAAAGRICKSPAGNRSEGFARARAAKAALF
jgi:hypothetical protein